MDYVNLLGFLAGTCTTIAFFPQAIKIHKTKDTKSLSLGMFLIFTQGIIFWLIYGFFLGSAPIIFSNAVTLIPAIYILVMKFRHR